MHDAFHQGLTRYLTAEQVDVLQRATVGIAGVGGLGSNTAMLLARSGLEHFILVDCDVVEASNLNRQFYFPRDLGQPKVEALERHLKELNPKINITKIHTRLTKENITTITAPCRIWVEALDAAESKALFVQETLLHGHKVASASGICGFGGACFFKRELGNLTLVGDFTTDMQASPPLAPKVTWAAAMLSDVVLTWLLGQ